MPRPFPFRRPLMCAAATALTAAAAAAAEPQTIVVSATRHAMPLADAPAAMSVVGADQIEARGADNALQALRGETGISLFGRAISGRKTISLRGMDPRHTLVLVDGRRVSTTDGVVGHSDFQLDWAGANDIDRIEVVRGPMSVLYGAEALGGVVQIVTKPLPDRYGGRAMAEGIVGDGTDSGGDGHRAAAALHLPLAGGLRLGVSAAGSRRQTVALATDPQVAAIEGRTKADAALKLQWQPAAGHRVDFDARHVDEDRWAGRRETRAPRALYTSWTDIERSHASLSWDADWGALQTQLRSYGARMATDNARDVGTPLRGNTLRDTVVDGQASAEPWAGQRLTGGFEWREEAIVNTGLAGGRGDATHQALYLQLESALLPKSLTLTAGLRCDHHSRWGTECSPRAYAVWRAAPQWVVKGGAGHGFKAPSVKQISADYRENEGPNIFVGNAALLPEVNDNVEAGFAWDTRHVGASAMVFHNRVRRLIVSRLLAGVPNAGTYTFENIDSGTLKGAETSLALRWPGVQLQASWTYLDARDDKDARLEKRPRHTAGLRADFARGAWSGGIAVEHHADQLLASTVAGQAPQPVPDLTFVGLHAGWQATPRITLRAGVDNVTDVRLAEKSPLFTYSELPRTWRVGLNARW